MQAYQKLRKGANHPDRGAQFAYMNETVKAASKARQPAISVDTRKKGLIGDATTTSLNVYARLLLRQKIKVTDEQIVAVNITGHQFHPHRNYKISPSVVNL